MKKITFSELKELNGKSITDIYAIEEPTEPAKGIIKINGVNVFGCFSNKVSCQNDTFAIIHFYNKRKELVANISVFNVNNECLVIKSMDDIYSETDIRVIEI